MWEIQWTKTSPDITMHIACNKNTHMHLQNVCSFIIPKSTPEKTGARVSVLIVSSKVNATGTINDSKF